MPPSRSSRRYRFARRLAMMVPAVPAPRMAMRFMGSPSRGSAAAEAVEDGVHLGFGDGIADERAIAPGGDDTVAPQRGQLLRHGRLGRAGARLQLAHRRPTFLHEVEQLEAQGVAEALDDAGSPVQQGGVETGRGSSHTSRLQWRRIEILHYRDT